MRIALRNPCLDDEQAFLNAVARSIDLHQPWTQPPDTPEKFRAYLGKHADDRHISSLAVLDTGDIVGCININEIVRGCFKSAFLGYYVFVPHQGRGLMKQALTLAVDSAFSTHGLHRLEANIQSGNEASLGLIKSMGFRHEGFSPRYLKIDGGWKDHVRYATTLEDWHQRQVEKG